jgi:uncharacterized membrane protein YphA (DoxX/SURF4 family)
MATTIPRIHAPLLAAQRALLNLVYHKWFETRKSEGPAFYWLATEVLLRFSLLNCFASATIDWFAKRKPASMSTASSPVRKTILLWVLRLLVAALFLFAAYAKLTGQPMMVEEFGEVGLGQWFRYFTGAMEVAGAVLLLVPRTSALGAIVLLLVDIGAFVAQLLILHGDVIHTLVIGAVLVALIYLQRDRLTRRRAPISA